MTDVDAAARALADARARFHATLDVARRDLAPSLVAKRTVRKTAKHAKSRIAAEPGKAGLAVALCLAFLFRKPIAGLVRRLFRENPHG